jgi:non-specific serine/threonine protein kinase
MGDPNDAGGRERAADYTRLAEHARDEVWRSGGDAPWQQVERELSGIRAALTWLVGSGDPADAEQGLRLVGALRNFWHARGRLGEGRRWFARYLALPQAAGHTAARARALDDAGALAFWDGDPAAARALAEEALAIERGLLIAAGPVAEHLPAG